MTRSSGHAPVRAVRGTWGCGLALFVTAVAAAGCSSDGEPRNKAGAEPAARQRVLIVESANGGSAEASEFARRVEARSGGAVKVDIRQSFSAIEPGDEARLAGAVRAGEVDFGIVQARAWPAAGAPAFEALLAPFVLGDYAVAQRALAGPAGATLKAELERVGVVPLALVPTQLRRVLASEPLTSLRAYRGLRIRVNDNATAAAVVRALGAQPLEEISHVDAKQRLDDGRLDGVETVPVWALTNAFWRSAHHITGYALFASAETFVASPAAWERLSESEQAAIRAAAADTERFASSLPDRDSASLEELCRLGVRVTIPAPPELDALAAAAEPVRARLRAQPATAEAMKHLEATDGTGPRALTAPAACSAPRTRARPRTHSAATIPEGTYVVRTTREDFLRREDTAWPEPAYTWTNRLRNGRFTRLLDPPQRPDMYAGRLDGRGTYEVRGHEVTFRYTYPPFDAGLVETLRWSYFGGRLSFEPVDVVDVGRQVLYTAHPWQKVD
ncbi:MAG TPA: TRAP transporter substrate-binding protein DctP [Solirubrobacter sp.]|nr:TRAP transporter substrate-binding protein DctP [Solirubrobacter sp.]